MRNKTFTRVLCLALALLLLVSGAVTVVAADEVVKHKRMDTMEWMGEAIDYYEFVMKDSLGFLYIPDDAWKIYLAELSGSYGEFCVWAEGRASSTIYDTAESAEEIEQLSLHMFRGEATIQRQGSSDQPILQFTNPDCRVQWQLLAILCRRYRQTESNGYNGQ